MTANEAREYAERMCLIYDYYDMVGKSAGEIIDIIHAIEADINSGDVELYKEYLENEMKDITVDHDEWYHKECAELLELLNEFKKGK